MDRASFLSVAEAHGPVSWSAPPDDDGAGGGVVGREVMGRVNSIHKGHVLARLKRDAHPPLTGW